MIMVAVIAGRRKSKMDQNFSRCIFQFQMGRLHSHGGNTYIELGDGDELWENRKMEQIEENHREVLSPKVHSITIP